MKLIERDEGEFRIFAGQWKASKTTAILRRLSCACKAFMDDRHATYFAMNRWHAATAGLPKSCCSRKLS